MANGGAVLFPNFLAPPSHTYQQRSYRLSTRVRPNTDLFYRIGSWKNCRIQNQSSQDCTVSSNGLSETLQWFNVQPINPSDYPQAFQDCITKMNKTSRSCLWIDLTFRTLCLSYLWQKLSPVYFICQGQRRYVAENTKRKITIWDVAYCPFNFKIHGGTLFHSSFYGTEHISSAFKKEHVPSGWICIA
jgi:hypothetical protein